MYTEAGPDQPATSPPVFVTFTQPPASDSPNAEALQVTFGPFVEIHVAPPSAITDLAIDDVAVMAYTAENEMLVLATLGDGGWDLATGPDDSQPFRGWPIIHTQAPPADATPS
jgi:hypothetical protein